MKIDNFKTQDVGKAQKEHNCIKDLQLEIRLQLERGNYSAAEEYMGDMISSIKEIRKMNQAKKNHDKLMEVVNSMSARGVDLKVVARNA